jgi:hypothetical protein
LPTFTTMYIAFLSATIRDDRKECDVNGLKILDTVNFDLAFNNAVLDVLWDLERAAGICDG